MTKTLTSYDVMVYVRMSYQKHLNVIFAFKCH